MQRAAVLLGHGGRRTVAWSVFVRWRCVRACVREVEEGAGFGPCCK